MQLKRRKTLQMFVVAPGVLQGQKMGTNSVQFTPPAPSSSLHGWSTGSLVSVFVSFCSLPAALVAAAAATSRMAQRLAMSWWRIHQITGQSVNAHRGSLCSYTANGGGVTFLTLISVMDSVSPAVPWPNTEVAGERSVTLPLLIKNWADQSGRNSWRSWSSSTQCASPSPRSKTFYARLALVQKSARLPLES